MGLQHHKPAEGCRFTHAGKSWAGNLGFGLRKKPACREQSFRQTCHKSPPQKDGPNHQVANLAQILILAIEPRLGSGRLKAAPRPPVSSAAAEDQKQYDYYQDGIHYHHLLTRLDLKGDRPLTSLALIWRLSTDARTEL